MIGGSFVSVQVSLNKTVEDAQTRPRFNTFSIFLFISGCRLSTHKDAAFQRRPAQNNNNNSGSSSLPLCRRGVMIELRCISPYLLSSRQVSSGKVLQASRWTLRALLPSDDPTAASPQLTDRELSGVSS